MERVEAAIPLADAGSFDPVDDGLVAEDPLGFHGYRDALDSTASPWGESVGAGPATIGDHPVELVLFDFGFIGGSMGQVAGERIARAMERGARRRVPVVMHVTTGGARMQEGMAALVQMPKVVAARISLGRAQSPLITVLAHPTTGGVLASVAALADLTLAISGAVVGFAGPRIVESFTGRRPTRRSHRAESALQHGLVDDVVAPDEAAPAIARFLDALRREERLIPVPPASVGGGRIDPWDAVRAAREPGRPRGRALVGGMGDDGAVELRGDRQGHDDPALVTAVLRVAGRRVLVLALDHPHAPGPGAYRKARRVLQVAERLGLPVATIVDTKGADPSPASENSGIAWEIARLFETILTINVPVVSVVTGEGGSGGALAFAAADRLLIYRDAIFSVIGPEAAAQILWRDSSRAAEAARLQLLTAHDLRDLGIADEVIEAPLSPEGLASVLAYHLARLEEERPPAGDWATTRRARWRDLRG